MYLIEIYNFNPYNDEIFLRKPCRPMNCFQFEIIINVLVSSFRLIWIPMLWVCGPLWIFQFFQCRDRLYTFESYVYRRQILKYKLVPALKELIIIFALKCQQYNITVTVSLLKIIRIIRSECIVSPPIFVVEMLSFKTLWRRCVH